MLKIHFDEVKIKEYAKIQANLCALKPNSSDETLDKLISEIPSNYLSQKDELMMILQLFTQYGRNYLTTIRGNVIKLLERLMTPIKTYLQNESSFFWNIFGGLFYLKLWFYQEKLITFEEILSSSIKDDSNLAKEYFLPEIIENAPEIFEKEIKFHITCPYDNEYLEDFKEMRKKHFKWVRDCCDCHDPSYCEIEKNRLRYALKTDDVDTFQKILSNTGMSVDSKIKESTLENFHKYSEEFSLIDFATTFSSIQIMKFLIMNNAKVEVGVDFTAILTQDAEIIRLIESNMKDSFKEFVMIDSIASWNDEMVEYSIENYEFDFIEKSDIGNEYDEEIYSIFNQTVLSKNFIFFESVLLPFLKKNPSLVDRNINNFVLATFSDFTCFFTKVLLQHPDIDVNFHSSDDDGNHTFLSKSITYRNLKAVSIFLEYENLLINDFTYRGYSVFQICCLIFPNIEVMKLLSNFPGFDINKCDKIHHLSSFDLAVGRSNFLAIDFIIKNFARFKSTSFPLLIFRCISSNSLYSLKLLLRHYISKTHFKCKRIVNSFKKEFHEFEEYNDEFVVILENTINEIKNENNDEEDDNENEKEYEDDKFSVSDDIDQLLALLRQRLNENSDDESEEEEEDEDEEEII